MLCAQFHFAFSGEDLHDGLVGRGVLGQFLTGVEAEQDDPGSRAVEEGAAGDSVGDDSILGLQVHHLAPVGGDQRLLTHAWFVPRGQRISIDAGQVEEASATSLEWAVDRTGSAV